MEETYFLNLESIFVYMMCDGYQILPNIWIRISV